MPLYAMHRDSNTVLQTQRCIAQLDEKSRKQFNAKLNVRSLYILVHFLRIFVNFLVLVRFLLMDSSAHDRASEHFFGVRIVMSQPHTCLSVFPSFLDQARLLSSQYKALSDKEMKKWTKKAEQDKIRYQEEMKHYVPMEEEGGRKKKAKKDPNAPKRNMSAYFLYSMYARPQVKEDNPDASFGDIARIISEQFKTLPDKEKKKWDKKASEDKERYQAQLSEYNS
jgi:HMG (high mobility group) box/HMG-box domain